MNRRLPAAAEVSPLKSDLGTLPGALRPLRIVLAGFFLVAPGVQLAAQQSRIDFLFTIPAPPGVTEFGRTVALLGDINGDTFPDIAVAASSHDGGVVFFFSGRNGELLGEFRSPQPVPNRPDSEFEPAGNGGLFARNITAIPDANGDGIMDVAIGAPRHKIPGAGPLDGFGGAVYLVDPTDRSVIRTLISPNAAGFGQFGFSLDGFWTGAGQSLKGLLVGAPGENGVPNPPFGNAFAGRAYLFDVVTGTVLRTMMNPTENDGAEATFGNFGFAVAAISNTDTDFYISEPGANFSTNTFVNTGRIYLYQGVSSTPSDTPRLPNSPINPLRVVTNSRFGESLAALQFAGPNFTSSSGITYIGGHARNFPNVTESNIGRVQLTGTREFFSPNPQPGAQFGATVAAMLDATGNGRSEVLVGEPLRGSPEVEPLNDNVGFAHIFSTDGVLVTTLPRAGEPQKRARFGASISGTRMLHQIGTQSRRRLLVAAQGLAVPPFTPSEIYVYKVRTRNTGDLNNDFQVNATDLTLMQSVLNGTINLATLSPEVLDVLDVNNDGSIDGLDLLALRKLLGLNTNAAVINALLTADEGAFPGETDPDIIGFAADRDGDGLSNIFELWRGTDPARADAAAPPILAPAVESGTDRATIEVAVDPVIDDLLLVGAHISFDLITWREVTASRTLVSQRNGVRTLRFTDSLPLPPGSGFFARFSSDPAQSPPP